MTAFDLNEFLVGLAELPATRAELLQELPGLLLARGGLAAATSLIVDERLRVLASKDDTAPPGAFLPADGLEQTAFRGGAPALGACDRCACGHSLLALPLVEREQVIATLGIRSEDGFDTVTRRALEVLAQLLSARLTSMSHTTQLSVTAHLIEAMNEAATAEELSHKFLEIALGTLRVTAGLMLQRVSGVMRSIARLGNAPDAARAATLGVDRPYRQGLAWEACLTGESMVLLDQPDETPVPGRHITLLQPIGREGMFRWVLVLEIPEFVTGTPADQEMFDNFCLQLAMAFEQLQSERVQDRLLALQMMIADSDTADLYQQILDAACELVPGADGGSLQVRDSPVDPFRYTAVVGIDMQRYRDIRFSEADIRRWYAAGEEAWQEGRIRQLDASQMDLASISGSTFRSDTRIRVPGVESMRANLCMPVAYKGDVLAVMNLDSNTHEAAFGQDSVAALQKFAAPVASMLAAAHQRDRVVAASRTDDLTDLPNRRASNLALATELARAQRTGEPFTVFIMDLRHFKAINDAYGHGVGDDTLREVARRLAASSRMSDMVARWGGDEFAALLPATDAKEAELVADRLRGAVREMVVGDVQLDINIGMASYPDDGTTASDLLSIADHRMYADKQATAQEA